MKSRFESHTDKGGFSVHIDVPKWAEKDDDLEDWRFPLKRLPERVPADKAGTVVTVTKLHTEVVSHIEEGTLDNSLRKAIAQTYSTFIGRHATVKVNGTAVEPRPQPFGESELMEPGVDSFEHDGVKITLLTTVAPKSMRTQDYAGWYVLCNGRTVVAADKTELTGWGVTTQAFHSKFLAFAGLASFTSNEPVKLPWTTTKRGLNRESPVYQLARNRMGGAAEPVLRFLTRMYPSDLAESPAERVVAETVKQGDFRDHLGSAARQSFHAQISAVKKRTARIQFDADIKDIDRIKKRLRSPSMSAAAVGKHTFDHFLKVECPE